MADNPNCPKCGHHNALLRNSYGFLICRDCGKVSEPDDLILQKRVLDVVRSRTREGIGIRTTESDELFRLAVLGPKPYNLSWNDGSDSAKAWYGVIPERELMKGILTKLAASKHIKFVTEQPKGDRLRGDYCWVVPADWVDRPKAGYIHVPKVPCEPFDLW